RSEAGFRLRKCEEGFVRHSPRGRQFVGVPLVDYNPEFLMSLVVCIRLDAAEEIFHIFSGSPPRYQSMSYTTITQLEYFTSTVPSEYKVVTQQDAVSALNDLSGLIRDRVFPFLNRYSDVNALDQAMSSDQHPQPRL